MAPNRSWRNEVETVTFAVFAIVVVVLLYTFLIAGGTHPRLEDFHTFWLAGRDYLHHRDPYPARITGRIIHGEWFVYPAPVAALFVPLGALPYSVAAGVMTVLLVAATCGAVWLLGVRDVRCYLAYLGSVVVLTAVNLGTMTPFLMLALAGCWRLRRRGWPLAATIAAAVLLKLFLWPLLVWTLVTGRRRVTVQALLITVVVSLVAWLPLAGSLTHYPSLLHQLAVHEAWAGYGVAGLAASVGASHSAAALVATAVLPLVGVSVWFAGRRLSERRAFAATIALSVVGSPVVWLHYFALAFVCIALLSPALSLAWFAPLLLWLTPWQQAWGDGWRIVLALVVLALPLAVRVAPRARSAEARGIVSA